MDPVDRPGLVDAAERHRLAPLLGHRLREAGTLEAWTGGPGERLAVAGRDAVMLEEVRRRELDAVVRALATGGVASVLFKGSALAYTVYPSPGLRPRLDTDLLIDEAELPRLRRILETQGYRAAVETSGALVTAQCHYDRVDRSGARHALDVHWRPFNPPRFAGVLSTQEVRAAAQPVPGLSPHARVPSTVHALLLACVHRAAHHAEAHDLLWLYDLHLLASGLDASGWDALLELAARRQVLAVCLRGLQAARACFGTRLPPAATSSGAALDALVQREGTAPYLRGDQPLAAQLWRDLRALDGWCARGRLVREHLLPPAGYLQARYGTRSRLALPFLYVWRACCGAPRWFRR
ncbi:MAG: nucleotidyltransferase family protein [Acidobacteriota bacterium]|nr:nucleotidyltransferase family protein [Acidobacteriota bacterium]